MWDKITLGKFQQLHDILTGRNFNDEVDRQVQLLACLNDRPADYYESMPLTDFSKVAKDLDFLHVGELPGKASRYITAKGRRFKVCYEFRTLAAGQYIDVMAFSKGDNTVDRVPNLHNILAAIVVPMRRTLLGWRPMKYGSIPHEDVATCMLEAKMTDVYPTALFFWNVWEAFIRVTKDYLVPEIAKSKAIAPEKLATLNNILLSVGDGC